MIYQLYQTSYEKENMSITKIQKDVLLVGPMKDAQKHGEYFYIQEPYEKGIKQYAGLYECDQRIGYWREIIIDNGDSMENEPIIAFGEYEKGLRKKQWFYSRSDETIGGGHYLNGQKTGLWIDAERRWYEYQYYRAQTLISSGLYENGIRIGNWTTYFNGNTYDRQLGGGLYVNGKKEGFWIEQVVYGDYMGKYQNGVRIGQWRLCSIVEGAFTVVAGGQYDEIGRKQGQWIDREPFEVYYGEYLNDKRVGYWINKDKNWFGNYEDGLKTGLWIETQKGDSRQIQEKGQYESGIRVGEWEFTLINEDEYSPQLIGKGHYDQNGQKQGKWIEIFLNKPWTPFPHFYNNISYQGIYKDNKQIGRWELYDVGQLIGGGEYDNDGIKQGQWIEHGNDRVIEKGIYKNGLRVGEWIFTYDFLYNEIRTYDEKGNKTGFWKYKYIQPNNLEQGEYKEGHKIGQWTLNGEYNRIVTENYDDEGFRSGSFIDKLMFNEENYEEYTKEYRNGFQIGQQLDIRCSNNLYNLISNSKHIVSKKYDDRGLLNGPYYDTAWKGSYMNDHKVGLWTWKHSKKLDKTFNEQGLKTGFREYEEYFEIIQGRKFRWHFSGHYNNGVPTGKWRLTQNQQQIGGGDYENGYKQGYWVEPPFNYEEGPDVTYSGQYLDERRIGFWKILYKNKEIGGGYYDDYGLKSGEWSEPLKQYNSQRQLTEQGKYQDGIKIGEWNFMIKGIRIGGGCYNENGLKEGSWINIDIQNLSNKKL